MDYVDLNVINDKYFSEVSAKSKNKDKYCLIHQQ